MKIIEKYESISDLASSDINFLKEIFQDIGLLYRADRLKGIASKIVKEYSGLIPNKWDDLIKINGIGNYICSAILCFGFNKRYAVLDVNVIRILERVLDIRSAKSRPRDDLKLWEFAQILLPDDCYVDYNYAILDFGATICTAYKPKCSICVFKFMCAHNKSCR